MQKARMLGNNVQWLADRENVSIEELSSLLNCSENQMRAFFKGRTFASYPQIQILAKKLGVSVATLLEGNEDVYKRTVVHCMNSFDDDSNREKILDIIDDYMDVLNAVQ